MYAVALIVPLAPHMWRVWVRRSEFVCEEHPLYGEVGSAL